ncbi:MAG: sugar transporter, partial [Gammaproteobacteria bacterium]
MEEDQAPSITPSYVFEVLRRRALWFLLPFVVVLAVGSAAAVLWPASYLSEGTILVQSPEIPSDLVRPTVSTAANERMQVIEQRIMTRDNLLAIAKKYHISAGWHELASGTQLVDFIRKRAVIRPVELTSRNRNRDAIAFKVGFKYENPTIAMKVANEFVTLILKEDVRARTSYATETTKFLARDVERIQDQLSLLDSQILEIKHRVADSGASLANQDTQTDDSKTLAALKRQLAVKSATLSSQHPDIIALKRQIKALEKVGVSDSAAATTGAVAGKDGGAAAGKDNAAATKGGAVALGLDTLETKRKSLHEELTGATQKLAAARLGESLERGQHSERLE